MGYLDIVLNGTERFRTISKLAGYIAPSMEQTSRLKRPMHPINHIYIYNYYVLSYRSYLVPSDPEDLHD